MTKGYGPVLQRKARKLAILVGEGNVALRFSGDEHFSVVGTLQKKNYNEKPGYEGYYLCEKQVRIRQVSDVDVKNKLVTLYGGSLN